jgi:hypothetical protein
MTLVMAALAALMAQSARAQTVDRAIEFDDLGFTGTVETSARAAGLSAFIATAGDATALVYNPAGLARARRINGALTFGARAAEMTTRYDGAESAHNADRAGLGFCGAAVPVPVVRGSFVPAAAVYRAFVSDLGITYAGYNEGDDRDDHYRLEQSGSTFAFALGAGVDLSAALSAGAAIFFLEGGFESLRQFDYRSRDPQNTVHTYVLDDITGDVGGIGGRVGLAFFAHDHLQVAVNFTTPTLVNVDVEQAREITRQVDNDVGTFERVTTTTSTEYRIPQRIDASVAVPWGSWLACAQVGITSWEQAAIDQQRLLMENAEPVLDRGLEWRAGVEWTVPSLPLRLRAGAALLPFATRYLQGDRVDNDRLEKQTGDDAPLAWSAGAGVLLRASIGIDASFTSTSGSRASASIVDARASSEFLLQGSYWF